MPSPPIVNGLGEEADPRLAASLPNKHQHLRQRGLMSCSHQCTTTSSAGKERKFTREAYDSSLGGSGGSGAQAARWTATAHVHRTGNDTSSGLIQEQHGKTERNWPLVRPRFPSKNSTFACTPTSKRAEPSEAVTGRRPRAALPPAQRPSPHLSPARPVRAASTPAAAPHPAGPAAPPAQLGHTGRCPGPRPGPSLGRRTPGPAAARPRQGLPTSHGPPAAAPHHGRAAAAPASTAPSCDCAARAAPPPTAHWPAPRKRRAARPLAELAVIGGAGGQWAACAPGAAGDGARGRAGHGGPAGPGRARPAQVRPAPPPVPLCSGPAARSLLLLPGSADPTGRPRHCSSARLGSGGCAGSPPKAVLQPVCGTLDRVLWDILCCYCGFDEGFVFWVFFRKAEEYLRLSQVKCTGLMAQMTATSSAVMCLDLAASFMKQPVDKVR